MVAVVVAALVAAYNAKTLLFRLLGELVHLAALDYVHSARLFEEGVLPGCNYLFIVGGAEYRRGCVDNQINILCENLVNIIPTYKFLYFLK